MPQPENAPGHCLRVAGLIAVLLVVIKEVKYLFDVIKSTFSL